MKACFIVEIDFKIRISLPHYIFQFSYLSMLRFTLLRVGRKRTTDYRIVVRERRSGPRSQKYIESVGVYNTKTKKLALKRERVQYWLSQGVQPSGTVHNMFVNEKIVSGSKMAVTSRRRQDSPEAQVKPGSETQVSITESPAPQTSQAGGQAAPVAQSPEVEAKPEVSTAPEGQ